MNTQPRHIDDLTLERIYSEFLEMPGLRLTQKQAQRLLGLDEQRCLQLLEFLVEVKFLGRPVHGAYSRLTDGRIEVPFPRAAKADVGYPIRQTKQAV